MKRFHNDGTKNKTRIPFEEYLNVTEYTKHNNTQIVYRLRSAVSHDGDSLNSGHYATIVCNAEKYYLFDDSYVGEVSWSYLRKFEDKSYILFYSKVNNCKNTANNNITGNVFEESKLTENFKPNGIQNIPQVESFLYNSSLDGEV